MKILHTSDWHLGKRLFGHNLREASESFCSWLVGLLEAERVDALLVSGDVFDSSTPPLWAQRCYFDVLLKARELCRAVVVTSGNHDSAEFLEITGIPLRELGIFVFGRPAEDLTEQVVMVQNASSEPVGLVAAQPFLHESDLHRGSSLEDIEALREETYRCAQSRFAELYAASRALNPERLPVVCMAHLFAVGAKVGEGDGMRDLAIGGLDAFDCRALASFDYVALGHVHRAQNVVGEAVRYSGSPLALGFGDAGAVKTLSIVDVSAGETPIVREIPVPPFVKLARLSGSFAEILERLAELTAKGEPVWVELTLSEPSRGRDLWSEFQQTAQDSPVEILCVHVPDDPAATLASCPQQLEEMSPTEVFRKLMEETGVESARRESLETLFNRFVQELDAGSEK